MIGIMIGIAITAAIANTIHAPVPQIEATDGEGIEAEKETGIVTITKEGTVVVLLMDLAEGTDNDIDIQIPDSLMNVKLFRIK